MGFSFGGGDAVTGGEGFGGAATVTGGMVDLFFGSGLGGVASSSSSSNQSSSSSSLTSILANSFKNSSSDITIRSLAFSTAVLLNKQAGHMATNSPFNKDASPA